VTGAGPGGHDVEEAVRNVRRSIAEACERAGREPADVRLVAVSKTVALEQVRRAFAAGVADFGENRALELAAKAPEVPARWHYLGKLQSGTVRHVADHADVVHSAEPGTALESLAGRAGRNGRSIDCLIEVDFTGARQGVSPEDLPRFAEGFSGHPVLRPVGLMTIPPPSEDPEGPRPYFARLRELLDGLRDAAPGLVELSMGMSSDYEVAVEEGATMVRVGTALFGPRPALHGLPGRDEHEHHRHGGGAG